ncbi:MAG: hypothetical protein H7647_11250 [Candidatus Heimdallarchaeota archaeon]|nr:hypothetical protein [Candidatus Heimdallarchaeota archaeon]MCK4255003.1 hypothetical protein [Candidatus Heimdallarchaeota archaeon]
MIGFYVVNKDEMEVLFCRPHAIQKEDQDVDDIVKFLLQFYSEAEKNPNLEELQVLKFGNTQILFMCKYSFLFILLSPPNYSLEMVSSQLFFFMKLFLNAFEVKDETSSNEFLQELEGIRRREVSESLSHSFLLWNVLDLHIEDIDKRNLVEVFENILNSIWIGIKRYIDERNLMKIEDFYKKFSKNLQAYLDDSHSYLKEVYSLTLEEGFDIHEVDIKKITTSEIKREFIYFLKNMLDCLQKEMGEEGLRYIIAQRVPVAMKVEWQRLDGLGLIQDLLDVVWR